MKYLLDLQNRKLQPIDQHEKVGPSVFQIRLKDKMEFINNNEFSLFSQEYINVQISALEKDIYDLLLYIFVSTSSSENLSRLCTILLLICSEPCVLFMLLMALSPYDPFTFSSLLLLQVQLELFSYILHTHGGICWKNILVSNKEIYQCLYYFFIY